MVNQGCPNHTRVCGGKKLENQYCIEHESMCPINDVELSPISKTSDLTGEVYNLDPQIWVRVMRDSDQHPIVNLKLSEEVPCLDKSKINHNST